MLRLRALSAVVVLLASGLSVPMARAQTRSETVRVDLAADHREGQLRIGVTESRRGVSVPRKARGLVEAASRAPFGFSALGLVLHGQFPAGSRVRATLEVSEDGVRFDAPVELPVDPDLSADAIDVQVHGLLLLPEPRFQACRWRLELIAGTASPTVSAVDLHFIDSTRGPTEREMLEARERPNPAPRRMAVTVPKPPVVSRAAWGARPATQGYSYCQPTTHLAVHYSASQGLPDADLADCASHVRAIQAFHMDSRGWIDVGYNYLICRHGTIFEGRGGGDNVQAAHDGFNCDSMGVCAIGYFHQPYNEPVPEVMLRSYIELFAWKAGQNGIDPQGASLYRSYGATMNHIYGHRNVKDTSCPGDGLYPQLQFLRDEVERRLEDLPTPKGNLVGLILDAATQARLAGATCQLTPGPLSFVTGADGYYRFEQLTAGQTYTVSVTHPGHKPQSKSRLVEAGVDNWNSLWLEVASTSTVAVK